MRVRVTGTCQIVHEGTTHTADSDPEFEANDTDARNWIRLGYAEEVGGQKAGTVTLDSPEEHRSVEDHEMAVQAEANTESAAETLAKAAQLLAEAETTEPEAPEVKSPVDSPEEHKSVLDHEMAVEADSKAEYASETQEKLPDTLAAALKATEEQEEASTDPLDSVEHHKSPSDHQMAVQAEEAREPIEETRAKTAEFVDKTQKAAEKAAGRTARGTAKQERADAKEERVEDRAAKAAEREADKAAREAVKAEDKAVKVQDDAAAKDEEAQAEEEKAKAAQAKARQTSANKAQAPTQNK